MGANANAVDYHQFTFTQLVNMADTDESIRPIIAEHMQRVHRIHDVLIRIDHPDMSITDTISINNFEVAEKFLRHFGHLITRLEFSNNNGLFNVEQLKALNHCIETHCAQTLERITLINVGNHLVCDTTEVFPRVTRVALRSLDYPAEHLALDRIYPMMEWLEIHAHYPRSMPSIVRNYPNLRHLKVEEFGHRLYNEYVHDLLGANPQLTSVSVNTFPDVEFLRFVREKLTKLEALEFTCNRFDRIHRQRTEREVVHFESVRSLTLHTPHNCLRPLPITFDRLEKVRLDNVCDACEPTIREIFEQNPKVKMVSVSIAGELYPRIFAKMMELMHMLPELEHIELPWTHHIDTDDAMRWMRDFDRMQKVMFKVPKGMASKAMEAITVPEEWEMEEVVARRFYQIYTFVRKQ